jgi:hypothetical protein
LWQALQVTHFLYHFSKTVEPFLDLIASKILTETAMADAFTKLSNVMDSVLMDLRVVAADVCRQTAGILTTIEGVEINAFTNTTNAMETALMDTQHVEAIAAYKILLLRVTLHVAKAVCTKRPGQPIILEHVEIGVFIGEIIFLSNQHTMNRNIASGTTSTNSMNVLHKAVQTASGQASLVMENV